ncbi:MAG TPA: MBL fold metallo-hydrolase [Chloroflexota bacterium]|nr:MBL fold metallo-hydrolase [Chloroflexota bacterium]
MPVQIAAGVYQLGAVGCQVFALVDDGVTLVDAGGPGSGRFVLRQLRAIGVFPDDVRRIVLTHYHIDHRGAAAELRRATGARVLIHATEAPYLRRQIPYPNPVQTPLLRSLFAPLHVLTHGRPVPVDVLQDDDTIDILGGVRVLHAPGHTRGSVVLSVPQEGLLLAGDTMGFRARRLEAPEPRVSEDTVQARASLERLAGLDIETIAFSHFEALRSGARRALEALVASWSVEVPDSPAGRAAAWREQ